MTLAIMLAKPIPFVEEFLTKVEKLEYPASKIDLYLYSNQKYNEREVSNCLVILLANNQTILAVSDIIG